MDIYSKYGMVLPDMASELAGVADECFTLFVWKYGDLSPTEQRQLFHEFINNLQVEFAEHALTIAMRIKKEEQKTNLQKNP